MRNIYLIVMLALASLSATTSESGQQFFVQFKIFTVSSIQEAEQIDEQMRLHSGIEVSRTDASTSTYFCIINGDYNYTEQDFVSWFQTMGYGIGCFSKGVRGVQPTTSPHILSNCQQ